MRKLVLATVLTGLMTGSVALAIPNSGQITVTLTPGSQYSDGGQFTATVSGYPSFQTFCIEEDYVFSPGSTYNYTLGLTTHGAPPITASTVLNLGTAWLYSQFISGAFGGLNLTPTQAGQLQAAFWFFQGQGVNPNGAFSGPGFLNGGPGDSYYNLAITALGASAFNPSLGAYGVRVIQSTDANGNPAQDWLAVVPRTVPDGGTTAILLGLGLLSVGLASRKFAAVR